MVALKKIYRLYAAGLLALLAACSQPLSTEPENADDARVTATFSLSKAAVLKTGISRLVITVSGTGMKTMTLDTTVSAAAEGRFQTTLKVTPGKNRLFQVSAFQDTLLVLTGKDSLDLKAGQKTALRLTLQFQVPALTLTPIDTTLAVNSTLTVYVKAHHVDSLCTIGTKLKFDPAKLQVVELGREDDFLKKNGGAVTQLQFSKDNTAGEVILQLGIFPAGKSVSGEGKIARILFKATATSTADIDLNLKGTDLGLYDKRANPMQAVALGSHIVIQ
ncbi:MAG TPA: cohesin domain-containing protein [bacterium]|nr:cohesin domain-containing protein [bacterium]HQG45273.1 cohesin domain-containing protein [bacterium]HQI48360.1 cohesin domain-containing protein [bacterium]HQJ63129.1 cohesin domain-containing protein [bacterium]